MFSRSSNKNNGFSGSGFGRDYRGFLDISRLGSSDSRSQRSARKKREEDWNSTYSGSSSSYPEKSKLARKATIPGRQPRRTTATYHHTLASYTFFAFLFPSIPAASLFFLICSLFRPFHHSWLYPPVAFSRPVAPFCHIIQLLGIEGDSTPG